MSNSDPTIGETKQTSLLVTSWDSIQLRDPWCGPPEHADLISNFPCTFSVRCGLYVWMSIRHQKAEVGVSMFSFGFSQVSNSWLHGWMRKQPFSQARQTRMYSIHQNRKRNLLPFQPNTACIWSLYYMLFGLWVASERKSWPTAVKGNTNNTRGGKISWWVWLNQQRNPMLNKWLDLVLQLSGLCQVNMVWDEGRWLEFQNSSLANMDWWL